MARTELSKEHLDIWWKDNQITLDCSPGDWNAMALKVMLENEYDRLGLPIPEKPSIS